jgi:hypothetical protein
MARPNVESGSQTKEGSRSGTVEYGSRNTNQSSAIFASVGTEHILSVRPRASFWPAAVYKTADLTLPEFDYEFSRKLEFHLYSRDRLFCLKTDGSHQLCQHEICNLKERKKRECTSDSPVSVKQIIFTVVQRKSHPLGTSAM